MAIIANKQLLVVRLASIRAAPVMELPINIVLVALQIIIC